MEATIRDVEFEKVGRDKNDIEFEPSEENGPALSQVQMMQGWKLAEVPVLFVLYRARISALKVALLVILALLGAMFTEGY